MVSKNKYLLHLTICMTFLVIPLLLTPPHKEEFGSRIGDYLLLRKEATNLVLLLFFYVNYYYLVPRYHFTKKYLQLAAYLFLSLLLCLAPDLILNQFTTYKHNFTFFINSQITVFLFLAVYFITYSMRINDRLKEAQLQVQQSQYAFLKGQINPHFLFNTLNSIYALSVKKSDQTPSAIVKLSEMIRYTLTEVEKEYVLLDKEIQFLNNYIALQKNRLGDTCTITTNFENQYPQDKIIPLVFIAFVENAFKFGVSADGHPLIAIQLQNNDGRVFFRITNQKLNKKPQESSTEIGISNTKKRLLLLYPNKHHLHIVETDKDFCVELETTVR